MLPSWPRLPKEVILYFNGILLAKERQWWEGNVESVALPELLAHLPDKLTDALYDQETLSKCLGYKTEKKNSVHNVEGNI